MKNIDEKKLYIIILLCLCLVSLFLICTVLVEVKIKKTKHLPISNGLTYNYRIPFIIKI